MKLKIIISPGELIDRISILEIKLNKFKDDTKRKIISEELFRLYKIQDYLKDYDRVKTQRFKKRLYKINFKLWNIENRIRNLEAKKKFNKDFIELARNVYLTNDLRTGIKNEINKFFGAEMQELKEYKRTSR